MAHLDLTTTDRYARGLLTPVEVQEVEAHVAGCTSCSKMLSALRESAPAASTTAGAFPALVFPTDLPQGATEPDSAPLPPGTLVDRYVVLQRVGAGGMGVVYAAYDPQLDRKVALKLLRRVPAMDGALAQARLLREAQAVARLSHPNVVSVYDAGKHGDQVFVALELVEGQHLRAWLRECPRRWRAVLEVVIAAGRGLEAAHAAGLVHRDFKPENVLVGTDGWTRVADFGLVRPAPGPEEQSSEPAGLPGPAVPGCLTQAGAILGTPGYMAPEQVRGQVADARTDQFAFAVTVVEALTGERPRANDVPEAPRGVPAAVMRVLTRGLLEEREHRFASMNDLLGALERAAAVRMRRRSATVVVTAALLLLLGREISLRSPAQLCHGGEERFATAWDAARAEAVGNAFLATGSPLATDALGAVRRFMDQYGRAWTAAYTDACEATHVRREQPESVLGLRMACLERRRQEVQALSAIFTRADREVVLQAAQATSALSTMSACEDVERLIAQLKPPDDAATHREVDRIHRELAEVKELLDIARYADGEARAAQLVDQAIALGYAPLLAEALSLHGELLNRAGGPMRAAQVLIQAELEAEVARDYTLATEISARLARLLIQSTEYAEGSFWIERGEAILVRAGSSQSLKAQLLEVRARWLATQGRYQKAIPLLRQALLLKEQVLGPDHLAVSETLAALAQMLWPPEDLPDVLKYAQRALALVEKAYGPDHPEVGSMRMRVGAVFRLMHRHDEERAHVEHALEIYLKVLGPDHIDVARARWNLATALELMGNVHGALDQYRQALPVIERTYGPENLRVGSLIGNIANLQTILGDTDAGIKGCQREIVIAQKALPPSSPKLFSGWLCLGDALTAKERWDEADSAYARATQLALWGEENPELTPILESQAKLAVRRRRPAEALSLLERADKMRSPWFSGDRPREVAGKLVRARALDALGRSKEATVEVQRVFDILETTPTPNRMDLDQARELMAALRRK